jgi:hypothetical protein
MADFLLSWEQFFHLLSKLLEKYTQGNIGCSELDHTYNQLDNCMSTLQYLLIIIQDNGEENEVNMIQH